MHIADLGRISALPYGLVASFPQRAKKQTSRFNEVAGVSRATQPSSSPLWCGHVGLPRERQSADLPGEGIFRLDCLELALSLTPYERRMLRSRICGRLLAIRNSGCFGVAPSKTRSVRAAVDRYQRDGSGGRTRTPRALAVTLREVPHQCADKVVCMQSGNGLAPMADIPMGRSEDVVHLGNCKNAFLNEAIEHGCNDGPAD